MAWKWKRMLKFALIWHQHCRCLMNAVAMRPKIIARQSAFCSKGVRWHYDKRDGFITAAGLRVSTRRHFIPKGDLHPWKARNVENFCRVTWEWQGAVGHLQLNECNFMKPVLCEKFMETLLHIKFFPKLKTGRLSFIALAISTAITSAGLEMSCDIFFKKSIKLLIRKSLLDNLRMKYTALNNYYGLVKRQNCLTDEPKKSWIVSIAKTEIINIKSGSNSVKQHRSIQLEHTSRSIM